MSNPELRASEGAAPPVGVRSLPEPAGGVKASPASFTLTLPLAPSTNGLYATRKKPGPRQWGRRKSEKYMKWIGDAGWTLKMQKPPKFVGSVAIAICVPKDMRGDIDNRCKATMDLLVTHKVITDDNKVEILMVKKSMAQPKLMAVTISAVKETA